MRFAEDQAGDETDPLALFETRMTKLMVHVLREGTAERVSSILKILPKIKVLGHRSRTRVYLLYSKYTSFQYATQSATRVRRQSSKCIKHEMRPVMPRRCSRPTHPATRSTQLRCRLNEQKRDTGAAVRLHRP